MLQRTSHFYDVKALSFDNLHVLCSFFFSSLEYYEHGSSVDNIIFLQFVETSSIHTVILDERYPNQASIPLKWYIVKFLTDHKNY